jgi:hypothetical protein
MLWSVIHFESILVLVQGERRDLASVVYIWIFSFPSYLSKRLFVFQCMFWAPLSMIRRMKLCGFISETSISLVFISFFCASTMLFLNDIFHRNRKINSEVHIEAQKTMNLLRQYWAKRAILEISQFLTSNYTTEPWQ